MSTKKGVLLLQMGGPNSIDEVENFLYNLFNDKHIIQLPKPLQPFQSILAKLISSTRAPKVKKLYNKIGGKSPILFETQCQAKALEKRLNAEYKCYIAMRYSSPFLKDTIKEMERDGIEELTVIPLYPQFSTATSGSSLIECKEMFLETGFITQAKVQYIESWYDHPKFIELITNRIEDQLQDFEPQAKITILFSAHGLPEKYIAKGDPYQDQIEATVKLVIEELINHGSFDNYHLEWTLAYQSRVGPVKWLDPYTDKVIEKLGQDGLDNLVVVPISFVGDHIETLEEIGIQYRELALESGIKNFRVTRLPKANPLLVDTLAQITLQQHLQSTILLKS